MKPKKKTALICGISGQDGAYLARLLLEKGYRVTGTSRDARITGFHNLNTLGLRDSVDLLSMNPMDFRSVLQVITQVIPDEIYNLSGQTSVGLSYSHPVETIESISIGTLNLLEAIRFSGIETRFYNASSGECFGHTGDTPADETTQFRPKSPYAVAKAAAYWEVANYRDAYNLFCCSGLLFNHESPLRPERFVTQKIVRSAIRIANGSTEKLKLGNIKIARDWGWAPEYVETMWAMLQQAKPDDFIIATGKSHTLDEFVQHAFECVGLDYSRYLEIDKACFRNTEIEMSSASPAKAKRELGWTSKKGMKEVIESMISSMTSSPTL